MQKCIHESFDIEYTSVYMDDILSHAAMWRKKNKYADVLALIIYHIAEICTLII